MRKKLFPKHVKGPAPQASPELESILEELRSPDDQCRADAVRKLCPCRGVAWDVPIFQQVIALKSDPSPVVRQAVEHDLGENPGWGKRSEARKLVNRRARQEYREVEAEIERVASEGVEADSARVMHHLGWRTLPRRKTRKKHRLSR